MHSSLVNSTDLINRVSNEIFPPCIDYKSGHGKLYTFPNIETAEHCFTDSLKT